MLAVVTSPTARGQSSRPSEPADRWDAKWFAYRKPAVLAVEETTPTADQVNFWQPPLKANRNAPAPKATGPAVPMTVLDTDIVHLRFTDADGNIVPALLCKPHGKAGPFPVVIATHGYRSNKAQVCAQVAPELIKRAFAVLAADMPYHGERPGNPSQIMEKSDWLKSYKNWREAVIDDLERGKQKVRTGAG
jgi:hypothetical protein